MGRVFFILTTLSLMLALLTNRAPSAASALLNSAESGVSLMLTLLGTMTLWSGLMEVLLRTGDVAKLGLLIRKLFRRHSRALPDADCWEAVGMNLAANILGLGNAATPPGVSAAKQLVVRGEPGLRVLALLLVLTGVVFCYFAVYSLAVDFFLVAGDSLATPMLSIDKYVSFLFGFLVPFGVAFQLPVVLYLTTRVGLTTPDMLRSKRKYVILAIFVLAAILTPPDVVSQVALGLPMCGLYEIGILVSRCTKARERA